MLGLQPPRHPPWLRPPSTYWQNESCERGQLAGVLVDPLLQLQDTPRLECDVSCGVKQQKDTAMRPTARWVKESAPMSCLPGALQTTCSVSDVPLPPKAYGPG